MNRLIINADDFGKSKDINYAILKAFELNLCMDTTLLVNFEDSEHAASLAIDNNIQNQVGIHLNLTEGFPLTDSIKKERRFCNPDGRFHYKKNKRIIKLSKSEKKAVNEELSCQIQRCRNFGISISHADSHNHIHEEPGMLLLIAKILKKEKIPFLRITKNMGKTSLQNLVYRGIYNTYLSFKNQAGTNYFGSISDLYVSNKHISNSIIEIMVHPGSIIRNQIYDHLSNENLSLKLPAIINKNKLISYNQITE